MIEHCREMYPVSMMCAKLKVSSSGYYEWRHRPISERDKANQALSARIQSLHEASDGVLGRRRIRDDLAYEGIDVGVNRVGRLMKRQGLYGIPRKRRWRRKPNKARPATVKNHLERDFSADAENSKWVTDITYIRTAEHWLYLCVVIDLHSKLVVGWSMSATQDRQLVLQAVLTGGYHGRRIQTDTA